MSAKTDFVAMEQSVETFRNQAQRLIDSFKQFAGTGSIRDGFFLSDSVAEFAAAQKRFDYAPEVVEIGDSLHKLENERRKLLESVQTIVVSPLEEFLRSDVQGLEAGRAAVEAAREEVEGARLRYDVARTSGKASGRKGKELEEAKARLELAEGAHQARVADVLARKEFEVVEKLASYVFAQASYFHEGHRLLAGVEPAMRAMMGALVQGQSDYLEGKHREVVEAVVGEAVGEQLMQGYVSVKRKAGGWAKRWMVVQQGSLYLYKSWKDLTPLQCVSLLLCTAKRAPRSCLLVISPEVQMTVQAGSDEEALEWVAAVEAGIGWQLARRNSGQGRGEETQFAYLAELRAVSQANCVCADCDQAQPEWGLMNLGLLICYECSGVHRSLGVHISKVRSLTLDAWNEELFHCMKVCGNRLGNQVYEALAPPAKPTAASSRGEREAYIRAKYEEKQWVAQPAGSKQQQQEALLDAATRGDLHAVLLLIAQGVDVNFKVGDPDDKLSLLHKLTIDGKATTYVLEILIQNGAQVYAMTAQGYTPLHYAALHDRVTAARMLMMRGASEEAEDKQRVTPKKLAEERLARTGESQVLQYFKGQIADEDLAGMQPEDMQSLRQIKASFAEGIAVVRARLTLLRQELQAADTTEQAADIMRKLRVVKLAVCYDGQAE